MIVAMQSHADVAERRETAFEEAKGKHFSWSDDTVSQAVTILPQAQH